MATFDSARYLAHCTRRRDGPWPEQSEDEYLDDFILGTPSRNHSAFAALMRIVMQRRLIASPDAIRGATSIVSFTAVPLAELPKLRTFRSHRARWDFEPYGIAIDRDWLERCGTRPVVYGDDNTWAALSDDQRPYFQKAKSEGKQSVDWTIEREWRSVGDVDLSRLNRDDAILFVPTADEARQLAAMSPWQVVVLNSDPGFQL